MHELIATCESWATNLPLYLLSFKNTLFSCPRAPHFFSWNVNGPQISRWITELVLSHVLGYILYLVIEAPFNNLTKQFFGKVSKQEAGKQVDAVPAPDMNDNIRNGSKIKSS